MDCLGGSAGVRSPGVVLDAGDLARRKASVAAAYHQLSAAAITVSGSAPAHAAALGIAL